MSATPPSESPLAQPLTLPCGATLRNRIMKSACSEQMGNKDFNPTPELATAHARYAAGGLALNVSGNLMIDRRALGEPANVVLDERSDRAAFTRWTRAATADGAAFWAQLNHPGKQSPRALSPEPLAPSAIGLAGALKKGFAVPRAMSEAEIATTIADFAHSAELAREFGFTGVQIHGAHGYLVSQFLSPRHNRRDDDWGGDAPRRMRFCTAVYAAIRTAVGRDFPVGIKLNSTDFQQDGFSEGESMDVIRALSAAGIDHIEISGGNYEAPAMVMGAKKSASTRAREAYFLDYAEQARTVTDTPLAITGGLTSAAGMRYVLDCGAADMVGVARALLLDPDLPNKVLADDDYAAELPTPTTGDPAADGRAMIRTTWYEAQIQRLGAGLAPDRALSAQAVIEQNTARFAELASQPRRA